MRTTSMRTAAGMLAVGGLLLAGCGEGTGTDGQPEGAAVTVTVDAEEESATEEATQAQAEGTASGGTNGTDGTDGTSSAGVTGEGSSPAAAPSTQDGTEPDGAAGDAEAAGGDVEGSDSGGAVAVAEDGSLPGLHPDPALEVPTGDGWMEDLEPFGALGFATLRNEMEGRPGNARMVGVHVWPHLVIITIADYDCPDGEEPIVTYPGGDGGPTNDCQELGTDDWRLDPADGTVRVKEDLSRVEADLTGLEPNTEYAEPLTDLPATLVLVPAGDLQLSYGDTWGRSRRALQPETPLLGIDPAEFDMGATYFLKSTGRR